MKKNYLITILVIGASIITACNSGNVRRNPGKTFAPDMTYSQAYDAYTKNNGVTRDSLVSQLPVKGTIARGQALPEHLAETDTLQFKALKNPYKITLSDLEEGQRLYNIYCGICHGDNVDGQGPLFTSGVFAAMPATLVSEANVNMPEGQMYHAVMYGKGMMGSYASQINHKQRWQVISYIKKVQSEKGGAPIAISEDGKEVVKSPVENTASDTTKITNN